MRLFLAVWAAKLSAVLGQLLGKKSSSTPGSIALRICPDIIKKLKSKIKNEVIVVCGTNGKTTTNNLLATALEKGGAKVVCNRLGANMLSGVATSFALACSWFGRFKADYACLEVDEAYTAKVFKHIKPDIVVVTNLFRDQLDRYGEIDALMDIMKNAFNSADYPTLILNGDDPVSSGFGRDYKGKTYYFGISEKVLDEQESAQDGKFCSICGAEQKYNYRHYSQLGDYYCPSCGNKRPKIDFEATDVDLTRGIDFLVSGQKIHLDYKGFYNIYNILGTFAAIKTLGIESKTFTDSLASYKPQIGRMQQFDLGKPFVLNLAKNPAGFNQAIQTVAQDTRKKDVVIAVNDKPSDGTDVSWLWDVDFERIADSTLNRLILSGMRRYDLALRFKYSGVKVDVITEDMKSFLESCSLSDAEVCYVLVNYTMLFSTESILKELETEKEKNKNV